MDIQRPWPGWVNRPRRVAGWALLLALLVGCSGEMSILDPSGPAAHAQFRVWWAMLAVSVVVSLVLFSLLSYTFWRRPQPRRTAWQEQRIMLRWVLGGGVLLPVVSIVALLVFGAPTGRGMLPLPLPDGEEAELIEVVGHQWWWEVRYPGDEDENDVVTANRLVMPAGEPVDFRVTSADVIHAFWIPRLGGKRDMVPGRHSTIRLEADAPGVFGAQCTEFCGAQHTNMLLQVEAVERDEFDAWLAERRTPPEQLEDHDEAREAFGEHCASCHRVEGLSDEFTVGGREYDMEGPDLSDIGSRPMLGAGVLPMEEGAIAYWLQHHQTLKPGNRMPSHNHIDIETLENIGAWLETLEP